MVSSCTVCNNLYVMQQLNLARLVAKLHTGWLEKFYSSCVLRTEDKLLETGCYQRSRKIQRVMSQFLSTPRLFDSLNKYNICILKHDMTYTSELIKIPRIIFCSSTFLKRLFCSTVIRSSSEKTINEQIVRLRFQKNEQTKVQVTATELLTLELQNQSKWPIYNFCQIFHRRKTAHF